MTEQPVALVTGAARGIGREVATQLGRAGYLVLLTARDVGAARATAPASDVGIDVLPLDITDTASVAGAVEAVTNGPGRLDVLVNNAAAYVDWTETATTADLDAARAVMDTNLYGAWRTTQALLPLLRESPRGRIVFVSSGAGSHGDTEFGLTARGGAAASYGITKAAVNALVSTLATELAESRILVNAVCPGLTATWAGAEDSGARPVRDGAASVVWAATLPDDGPTGGFFRDGRRLPW
jgi:NAD(P)-dependent dehydrogenase (short-subunit alcohol dehydrogenase family)